MVVLNITIIISSIVTNSEKVYATSAEDMVNAINQLSPEAQRYYSTQIYESGLQTNINI